VKYAQKAIELVADVNCCTAALGRKQSFKEDAAFWLVAGFDHSVITIKLHLKSKCAIKSRSSWAGVDGVHTQAALFISRFAGFDLIFMAGQAASGLTNRI
jgi:hypothetical protein